MERVYEIVKEWEYKGYKCDIRKIGHTGTEEELTIITCNGLMPNLWYCGYVHVQMDEETSDNIECHGGITFNNGERIGFDCNHYRDMGIEYQDIDYCTEQCELIVEQIIELKKMEEHNEQ